MLPGDDVPRPYVAFLVVWVGRRRALPALADSGADDSALPLWLARRLNVPFDIRRPRIGSGAGGAYAAYEAQTDVTLETELGFVTLVRPSINPHLPFALLGRRDFFAAYRVCFDQSRLRLEVTPAR